MPEKLQSEIREIKLCDATFKGTNTVIQPTYVNFFFGNNGTGKSTIAKAIQSGAPEVVTYAPGKTQADYLTLVYNQAFIDANVRNYRNLPGVFTINDVNVQIQEQIDEKEAQQATARKASTDAAAERDKKKGIREALLKQLYKDCWEKTAAVRERFDETQEKKRKSKPLTEEIRKHPPVEHDLDELRRMCDAAYSETAKRYQMFNTVPNTAVLDEVEGSDILGVVIANAAQTDFAAFLGKINATEWFRQGHSEYHDKTEGKCPYCSRSLQDGFEEIVTASFDDQYEKNLQKLESFLTAYRNAANGLFVPLSQIPQEIYPAIDIRPYNDKLAAVRAVIAANIDLIKEKKAEPTKVVTLEDTATLLQELMGIISGYNKLISENNKIVDAGPKKQKECSDQVFEHMAFMLRDVFEAYDRSDVALEGEIKAQDNIVVQQNELVSRLQRELSELRSQTVETQTAITNINTMLKDAGFQGFEVRPRMDRVRKPDGTEELVPQNPPINYEVVRTDTGDTADDLSEGEKNFIAFLYFQQKVFGADTAEGDQRQKIVVIDDPVSSMDSSALFIIGEQVRKMVEICRNNANSRDAVITGKFIKQIFILTHNAYFHREVTYPHANRYEYVSFYLVRKRDNKSSADLWRKRDPGEPSEWINVNPVKNSYAALWEEYKELKNVTSVVPLMNVIRRILEYYFLQLCGYDGSQLRRIILEENKASFTKDDAGNEDYTKFDMATSMLSYIAASTYGVNDGFHYVDDVVDIKQCRDTFQMIFHHMNQDQHFNMMMGIK